MFGTASDHTAVQAVGQPQTPRTGIKGGGKPMELGTGEHKDRLYFGNAATLFDVRRRAQKSIDATIADRPTFEQEFGRLQIVRCETE